MGDVSLSVQQKQLPPCNLSEEDLLQNPHFSQLLLSLSQHVDESGLSLTLAGKGTGTQVRALGEGLTGRKKRSSEREGLHLGFFGFLGMEGSSTAKDNMVKV